MRRGERTTALIATAAAVTLLAGCGGGSDGASTDAAAPTSTSTSTSTSNPAAKTVDWPYFGRIPERTHSIAGAPNPPFKFLWTFWAHQLIEFPPALNGRSMFVLNKTGDLFALRSTDGKMLWHHRLGNNETGPAYADGNVYVSQSSGAFSAVNARTGKPRWTFHASSGLQSSPIVVDGRAYFGSNDGTLYALDDRSGNVLWKRDLGPSVKASPSIHRGVLFVGDYGGRVHALRAASGKPVWTTSTGSVTGGGGFYSSPAVGFGRLYEARSDGTLFALDLKGHIDWHFIASNDIYASPAVADVKGVGPTVFIGSYNHEFYALDASNGDKRWTYNVGGEVPGSPTVVGNTVYTSSFDTEKTVGLDAATGKPEWEWGSAGYEPVISDGRYVFVVGFQTIWAFEQCVQHAGEPGVPGLPPPAVCKRAADLHLAAVQAALSHEKPKSSAARSGAGG